MLSRMVILVMLKDARMTLNRSAPGLLLAALLLSAQPALAGPDTARQAADIDAFVRHAMTTVGTVPGLSLAVVNGDEVVMVAGYGVADVETRQPVDADTAFYIASSTKSFTALAIARMADRGEVGLDEPLSTWTGPTALPADQANSVTLSDLLSHQSGLGNDAIGYRLAFSGQHTPAIMQALLGETTQNPEAPRGTFRYTNTGYNIATTLIEGRFGRSWQALVDEEVLVPAGMTHTTARISAARAAGVFANGHLAYGPDGAVRSPLQKVDGTLQSAGGLVSTARDMARWLELQINDGRLDGRQVFPAGLVTSTHRARALQDRAFGAYHRDGYGLGWQTGRYGEDVLIHHFGNFSGSRAHVSFAPARRLGVVVMVNEDLVTGELADLVANYVYDRFNERPDLEAAYDTLLATMVATRDRRLAALTRARAERAARPSMLSHPLETYQGTWVSPAMGTIEITQADGRLVVRSGVMSATAEAATDAESIRVELVPFEGQIITFAPDSLTFAGHVFTRQ
jgi:CubicO group peptidase (beta-lactamase class C family)